MFLHRVCPFCGRDNRDGQRSRYSRDSWAIKHCADCGFVYLENVLPYEELVARHAWTKSSAAEREFRQRREPVFSIFRREARRWKRIGKRLTRRDKCRRLVRSYIRRGVVLNVGCGGNPLHGLDGPLTPYGIEIGQEAARAANDAVAPLGGKVIHADALSGLRQFEACTFDGVLLMSFLEHENEPLDVLEQVARVLRPGGCVIIKVPNFASFNRLIRGGRWAGFRHPDHVNYFTPASLEAMIRRAGLDVLRCNFADRLPTSDSLWLVANKPDRG